MWQDLAAFLQDFLGPIISSIILQDKILFNPQLQLLDKYSKQSEKYFEKKVLSVPL